MIKKCILSTATYTEPVNIVIKHMAYMTDDKINIYETERTKKKVVSPLDIAFFPYKFPKDRNNDLSLFINEYLGRNISNSDNQNFHIICYSRKMAEQLGNSVFLDFAEIKLLTSNKKNKFQAGFNHIGTNFSTGVDIKKEGDVLIIIFPFKYKDEDVKGEEGIFYDGLPSILQSVARLRSDGRILFIIPPMKAYIKDEKTTELFSKLYTFNKNEDGDNDKIKEVTEDYIKDEKEILEKFIIRRNNAILKEQEKYLDVITKKNITRPEIQFPSKDTFILERGQEFIKYRSYKSGKYITPYVVWAALNDQYVNCSLENVYHFIRMNHYITLDEISEHLKATLPKNSLNEEFAMFYADAKVKLTQYSIDDKLVKVKIKEIEGDKILSINTVDVFWRMVSYYYSNKTSFTISSLGDYYKFCINDRKDKIGESYKKLKNIINHINICLGEQVLYEKDALSDDKIVRYEDEVREVITSIKNHDQVVCTYLKNKNAFWNINETIQYSYIRYILQKCFDRPDKNNKGNSRYILKKEWQ